MLGFRLSNQTINKCRIVLKKFDLTDDHINAILNYSSKLQRFPYAKAIETILLTNFKTNTFVVNYSFILKGSRPLPIDNDDWFVCKGLNRVVKRCYLFFSEMRSLIEADEKYKELSTDQINQEEQTNLSDSFMSFFKRHLLGAYYIPSNNDYNDNEAWLYTEKSRGVYYSPRYCNFTPMAVEYNIILDKYMDNNDLTEITFEIAVDVLTSKGLLVGNKKNRENKLRELLTTSAFGDYGLKRNRHWYIIRSEAMWPNF